MKSNDLSKLRIRVVMFAFATVLAACTATVKEDKVSSNFSEQAMIERGKYLVSTSACHDCHTPKIFTATGFELDSARLLSGHPADEPLAPIPNTQQWVLFSAGFTSAVGPWGVSFAANLTPDDTGTGSWSYEQFETAIKKGKYKGLEGSRSLLPPMPWEVYRNMKDEDLRAIFAYLRTVKPVNNIVPAPIAPEDMKARLTSN